MLSLINKRTKNEGGFTLIELLVVIIIIAILAAIAIPMYLSQRQKGWESNAKSDLRNAAVAQESYFTDNDAYTAVTADLEVEGWNPSGDVTLTISSADATSYCMQAVHDSGGDTWSFDSADGLQNGAVC
jgi:type IV pilus assembly protein PilA